MTKYTESADKKKDAKLTKDLSPKEKAMFKKADKKHRKPKSLEDDESIDKGIIERIKKKANSRPKVKPEDAEKDKKKPKDKKKK